MSPSFALTMQFRQVTVTAVVPPVTSLSLSLNIQLVHIQHPFLAFKIKYILPTYPSEPSLHASLFVFFFSSASHSELLSRFDVYKVFSAPLNFINLLTWNSEINFHYPL